MITKQKTESAFDRLTAMGGINAPDEAFDNPHHGHDDDAEFAEAVEAAMGHNNPPADEPATTGDAYGTREEWLVAFMNKARGEFASRGFDVPDNIRVSIGFPSSGVRSAAIGECWTEAASEDGSFEIFITPMLNQASRIADVLTHEICHAVAGHDAKHGKGFAKVARGMGLEGKMTATVAGENWHAWADPVLSSLGPLPGAGLRADFRTTRKKAGTRLLKAKCPVCELTFRITRKWYDESTGELMCPNSQVHMRVEEGAEGAEWPVHDGTLMVCEGVEPDEGEGE